MAELGTVIRSSGSVYGVRAADGRLIDCRVKGNFRLKGIRSTNPVAVGDYVHFDVRDDGTAYIVDILERRNYIVRKASNLSKQSHILAANLDQCFLVVTISHPATATTFIDRFLAAAEAYRVPVVLVFNKTDLYNDAELEELDYLTALYGSIGYRCLHTSAVGGRGVDELKEAMRGKVSLLAGNSGVGKSSLVNAVAPDVAAKVGEISKTHDTGMHTTTYTEMFEFMPDSYIVDTPGVKGFGTFDMEVEEISHYFVEFFELSKDCRYGNCTHTHEPGCAVLEALERGEIAPSRYQSYLSMLEDKEEGKYRASQ
ncbi:MAG: ribosome small subunit-dependent GTPase A [Bacteroidaceae bacterium]|nr:ribosome small subunit-dependent GTPase A [Bacteroidaceae bacterium]